MDDTVRCAISDVRFDKSAFNFLIVYVVVVIVSVVGLFGY